MITHCTAAGRFPILLAALAVLSALLDPAGAMAQTGGPPSDTPGGERPAASGARWALGAGVIVAPRPYVDADAEVQAIPIIGLNWGRWFVQGTRAGYRFLDSEDLDLDFLVRYSFSGLDPDDSPFLAGMEERRETVAAGLGLDWAFSELAGGELELELRVFTDVLGRSDGVESSVDLAWRKVLGAGRLILVPAIGMVHQNADQVDYYYGVRPDEATIWRPAYHPSSAFNPRASLLSIYRVTQRWALTGLVSVDFFDDEIRSSPIVDQSSEFFGLMGLSYSF